MKRVVVTGVGPLTSIGKGCANVWNSILQKKTNLVKEKYTVDGNEWGQYFIHKMEEFSIDDFNVPAHNFKYIKEIRTVKKEDIDLYYFLAVVKLAIDDSGLEYDENSNQIGLVIAHENPGIETFFEELVDATYDVVNSVKNFTSKLDLAKAIYNSGCEDRGYNLQTFPYLFSVAKVFDLHGYSLFINNACASGLFAIEAAARQIKIGSSPVVIVAAVDNPTKIYKYLWFKKHALYAEDGFTRPFSSNSTGIVFGDGGAAIVLEDLDHAKRRGANIYAEYLGGGFSLEGWKIMVPNIADDFYIRSFNDALKASCIKPSEIDFVNPHGVGLKATDAYEAKTINEIFDSYKPIVSAFKPSVGHNLGGSALVETVLAILSMQNNCIPPTLNCNAVDESLKLNIARNFIQKKINVLAKMACGFAGFNGVSIFSKLR